MHGTFSSGFLEYRRATDVASACACIGFAAAPILIATAIAVLRFGSSVTVRDILDLLSAAAAAAPL